MNSQHEERSLIDWRALATSVRDHDPKGEEQLLSVFAGGVRFFLLRGLGPHRLETRVQEVFATLTMTIRADNQFEPESMVGVVRTIVRRQIEDAGEAANTFEDHLERPGSSEDTTHGEVVTAVVGIVQRRPLIEQEAFVRFYLDRHTEERVCEDLKIGLTDFQRMRAEVQADYAHAIMRCENDNSEAWRPWAGLKIEGTTQ